MLPRRISILGVGLLGGSIGLAVKSRISGCKVVGYGHRASTLESALKLGVVDEAYDRLAPAVEGADLVVLCTPVGLFRSLIAELKPLLSGSTVLTDVGSTKRTVVAASQDLAHPELFVGSHPMAGSEKRGVEHSRADLYDGALCILTPTDITDRNALETVEQFWKTLGMRTCRISPEDHDRRLADVSHLPHALAAALVAIQESGSAALSGKGFVDMTRIAGGDGALWRDILLDNADNLRGGIARLVAELQRLSDLLTPGHSEELKRWLEQAAARRTNLINDRNAKAE